MIDHDRTEFSNIMFATCEMYNRKTPSNQLLEMYWASLIRFSIEDVQRAFSAHIQNPDNGQFMPKPADIVRLIEGDTQSQGGWAWTKVEKAIRHYGSWESICFDDPFIHRVISEMGGWISLCNVSNDELPFKAKEFEKRYRAYYGRDPGEYLSHLAGQAEAANSLRNQRVQAPICIGNKDRAALVYKNGIRLDKPSNALPSRISSGGAINQALKLVSGGA